MTVDDDFNASLASGEKVLISTRQHWVAAIRYAARPILLAIAAVLLWLLNGWLDIPEGNFLAFINDIIRAIVIVMLVVSIIWLPVDLVQWYSRRYVLTNRRAIRSYGIIRKHSLDTSLEQINDIGLTQSFLGRSLGY